MAVLRRRNKLVSFRVSEQEYAALRSVIANEGARSISDFARAAVCEVLDGNRTPEAKTNPQSESAMSLTLEKLTVTMSELNYVIGRLSVLFETQSMNGNGQ